MFEFRVSTIQDIGASRRVEAMRQSIHRTHQTCASPSTAHIRHAPVHPPHTSDTQSPKLCTHPRIPFCGLSASRVLGRGTVRGQLLLQRAISVHAWLLNERLHDIVISVCHMLTNTLARMWGRARAAHTRTLSTQHSRQELSQKAHVRIMRSGSPVGDTLVICLIVC
jgi:hypothetical protein